MRDKEEIVRTNLQVTMDNAFETGDILKTPEETLQKYLWLLCTQGVDNERVRHREVIRALTINHIQMQKHIDKLNKRNTFLQGLVIFLAVLAFIATGYQIYRQSTTTTVSVQEQLMNNTSKQLERKALPSKTSKEVPPSQTKQPQATYQTPRQDTSVGTGTPSESAYKDQKPSQSPPYEKKK
jgi:hypothetical protein